MQVQFAMRQERRLRKLNVFLVHVLATFPAWRYEVLAQSRAWDFDMAKRFADLLQAYRDGKRFGVYDKKGKLISYHTTKRSAETKAAGTDFEVVELAEQAMRQLELLETEVEKTGA